MLDPSNALIAALRRSECYPHSIAAVQVRETHISWVLLTGAFAYKIKKPVKLAFLDFSTLARRKHFCEQELTLNRRFSPQLYLDVLAITGSTAHPAIGAPGPAIEYAIKLKQFEPVDELSALIARRAVSSEELSAFGKTLASIHDTLPCVAGADHAAYQRTIALNLDELASLLHGRLPIEKPRAAIDALRTRVQSDLSLRFQSAAIRECHGDLHVGNVVRLQGVLTPFDCIEFDATLRNIDRLDDALFLWMDLCVRDEPTLAFAYLNAWLEASGDYPELSLVPYYGAHRALVRSKVAALQNQIDTATTYFATAVKLLMPPAPLLIITCGLSGSGKTWLSRELANRLPAIHVRSDVERKRLADLPALADSRSLPGAGIYTLKFNERTYERLAECARGALRGGLTAIVDAAFLRASERHRFAKLAQDCGAAFHILHCEAPYRLLRERIVARKLAKHDASEATLAVLAEQYSYFEPLSEHELAKTTPFQPNGNLDTLVAVLRRDSITTN